MCRRNKLKQAQEQAAVSQSRLSDTLASLAQERSTITTPFLRSRLEGGLPFREQALDFEGGRMARAFAPARAGLLRRLGRFGDALPSGFREQSLTDFDTQRARVFDESVLQFLMADEEARMRAAAMLEPGGLFHGAQAGYGSLLGLPTGPGTGAQLASAGLGAAGAIGSAAIIA